jgi:uncharacterized protein YlxW (UPF0749 family)
MNEERRSPGSAGQVAIALTVALLGFLLAIQLRAQEGLADRLAIERESDLGQILGELQTRSDRLLDEIVDLRVRLAQSTGSAAQARTLIAGARAELTSMQILLGIVPVHGKGIVVEILDPQGRVGPDLLLDAVQELRDAGAEAIDVGGVRVVAQTSFGGFEGDVSIDDHPLRFPLQLKAIGDPATLAEAMRIPGGTADTLGARPGAAVRISERPSISILSVSAPPSFTLATPRPRR